MNTRHVDGAPRAEELVPQIVQKMQSVDEKVVAFVRERPVVAIAAALAVGYLVGRIVSRVG